MNTNMSGLLHGLAVGGVSVFIASIALAASAQADPVYPPSYGSNGLYAVVGHDDARATAFIPPGRYRVEQALGMYPGQIAQGSWVRCSAFPCGRGYPQTVIATGTADPNAVTFVDILPTDAAVALAGVTLTIT